MIKWMNEMMKRDREIVPCFLKLAPWSLSKLKNIIANFYLKHIFNKSEKKIFEHKNKRWWVEIETGYEKYKKKMKIIFLLLFS